MLTLYRRLAVLTLVSTLCAPLLAADPPASPAPETGAPKIEPEGAAAAPLIPRALLFGNPERTDAGISPDGRFLSFLAPVDGAMNIWVAPFGKLDEAKPVTRLKGPGLSNYYWTHNPAYMLFLQDKDGDENDHVFRVTVATGEVKDLTPFPNTKAEIAGVSPKRPDEILVGMNARNVFYSDIHRINLITGESQRVLKNNKYYMVLADDDLKLRVGVTAYGPEELKSGDREAVTRRHAPLKGSIVDPGLPAFDDTGQYVYILTRNGRDTTSVARVHFKNGDTEYLADGRNSDIVGAVMSPITKSIQAVWEYNAKQQWQIVDEAVYEDFALLARKLVGEFYIHDRTLDDRYWIVSHAYDLAPGSYYLFDRKEKHLGLLFPRDSKMAGMPLAPMQPETVPARDGLKMVSYLTLPVGSDADGNGRPEHPLPMVLWVHGGPTSRDEWGYYPIHQWLANRGYAVLSVNYRGSSGFGTRYEDAGMKEWGGKMQADLDDATDWAVKEGIADAKRIAIGGASYGGYAALNGMGMAPDRYACGIDICGPSNLVTMIKENQAPYFKVDMDVFKAEIGDPDSKRGREFLLARSPISHVADVKHPLLIGQGSNDPRVYKAESDQFVKAMEGRSVPLTYLVYPDEGHGFSRTENKKSFYGAMEAFLAKHLGGRAEPLGTDLQGSSIQVVTGAAEIPGLKEAMQTAAPAP